MNIFVLDESPFEAAKMHLDKHCVKMVLETAQLLSTAIRVTGGTYGYQITHKNHPCSIWARTSKANFVWLRELGLALCGEYSYRYGKVHACESIILEAPDDTIPDGELTPFVQAMPDEFKVPGDAVQAYRNYYIGAKRPMLIYTNREPPEWLGELAVYHIR